MLDFWKWRFCILTGIQLRYHIKVQERKPHLVYDPLMLLACVLILSIWHVHTMGCFAMSSNCTILVSSFLPENKDEERKSTSGKKQGGFLSCASCHLTIFF